MTYDVLVRQKDSHYVAVALGMPEVSAEAPTRQDAIQRVSDALEAYLANSEIVTIDVAAHIVAPERKSLNEFIGMWSDDEQFDMFIEQINLNRVAIDANPDLP